MSGTRQCISFDNGFGAGFSDRSAERGQEVLSEAVVVGGWQGRQSPWWLDASPVVGGGGSVF